MYQVKDKEKQVELKNSIQLYVVYQRGKKKTRINAEWEVRAYRWRKIPHALLDWIVFSQIHVYPEPQNVTLLGNTVALQIKLY